MGAYITVLGSSSHGNGYIIHTEKESLVLEAGVPFKSVLKAEKYFLSRIKGVLVSHKHLDHARYIKKYLRYFIPVCSCKEVADAYSGVTVIEHQKRYQIGGFQVTPLTVPHNAECFAYIIDHKATGRILFATDLSKFNYRIKNIDTMMIEANYSEDLIVDAMCNGAEIRSHSENHMELNDCLQAIRNNATGLKKVVLLHLSDSFSNAKGFEQCVRGEFSVPTFAADKDMTIDISKYDF